MGIPGCGDRAPGHGGRAGSADSGTALWWDGRGSGEPLVLLHGGLADSRFFSGNVPALAGRFHVYTPDARGHGRTPDVPGPVTPELLLRDLVAFLTTVVGGPAHLAGHSMGGITALQVALRHPGLVRRLILISASIRPPAIRSQGPQAPDSPWPGLAELIRFLGPGYGEVSPDGEAHFPIVASKIVTMLAGGPVLAQADLGGVSSRTLVMAGDEDAVCLDDRGPVQRDTRRRARYRARNLALPAPGEARPMQRDHAGLPERRTHSRRPPVRHARAGGGRLP
jgi:pimeloyl-ACP methyl ester carboxylesterase